MPPNLTLATGPGVEIRMPQGGNLWVQGALMVQEWIDIDESQGPVFARGGSTRLRASRLHTPHTGDCINVKDGCAAPWDSVFIGSSEPDTDAINCDGITNGIISGDRIDLQNQTNQWFPSFFLAIEGNSIIERPPGFEG